MPEKSEEKKPDKEALLIEYQKAQDSAEHHDNLMWTVAGIVFATLTAFFQSVITNIWASLLGVAIIIALWIFVWIWAYYKNIAYFRCKEIESQLGMKHHLLTDKYYRETGKLEEEPKQPFIGQKEIMKYLLIFFGTIYAIHFISKILQVCNLL